MIPGRHWIEFDRYGRDETGERRAPQPERTWIVSASEVRADVPLERDWRSSGLDARWLSRARTREAVV